MRGIWEGERFVRRIWEGERFERVDLRDWEVESKRASLHTLSIWVHSKQIGVCVCYSWRPRSPRRLGVAGDHPRLWCATESLWRFRFRLRKGRNQEWNRGVHLCNLGREGFEKTRPSWPLNGDVGSVWIRTSGTNRASPLLVCLFLLHPYCAWAYYCPIYLYDVLIEVVTLYIVYLSCL